MPMPPRLMLADIFLQRHRYPGGREFVFSMSHRTGRFARNEVLDAAAGFGG
jgi:hypothetical protein